jgi:hypothetical protein
MEHIEAIFSDPHSPALHTCVMVLRHRATPRARFCTCSVFRDLLYIPVLFILVINQLDAQNFLFHNKFISCLYMFRAHGLIIRRSKLRYTASGIMIPIGGRPAHLLRRTLSLSLSTRALCTSSWLITKINILRCTVSKKTPRVSRYRVVQGCALVLTPIRWMPCGSTRCASVLTTERCTIYSTWHNKMFGAMCHSRKFDPFPMWEAVTVACAVTQELIRPNPARLWSRILQKLALPTTATVYEFCVIYIQNFPADVGLCYGTAVLLTLTYNSVIAWTLKVTKSYRWGLRSLRSQFLSLF